MVKPICFMVMPYGTQPTRSNAPGAPKEVDFDALWSKAIRPELESLGYTPIRADQDYGGLIIKEMLERLALSDLVLADISVASANVYYEVGVRHAARRRGCVLMAAKWAKPTFNISQMPRLIYPLKDGKVGPTAVKKVRAKIRAAIPKQREGESPVFQSVDGFPNPDVTSKHVRSFRNFVDELAKFQGRIAAARRATGDEQMRLAQKILKTFSKKKRPFVTAAALEVLFLVRDCLGWEETLAFIERLPKSLRAEPLVREQKALAESKSGDHLAAIAGLEALVRLGDSSERQGLLGGRYKKLYRESHDEAEKRRHLDHAIEHYEVGMYLDLNDYYTICNLPGLYQARGEHGDQDRARTAAEVTRVACERARRREGATTDEWLRPTLLGAAFQAGNVTAARSLIADIRSSDLAAWKLDTTLADLRDALKSTSVEAKAGLQDVLRQLEQLA